MKKLVAFLSVVFLMSCSAVRVNYDYDSTTNYSNYSTYGYYPDMQTGLSEFDTNRIIAAVDATMQIKGIRFSEEPDFYINIISDAYRTPQNSTVGVGLGGGGRNLGGGISIGLPLGQSGEERQISFDLVDSHKESLFWQATSTSNYNENASPEAKEKKLQEIVNKVFEKYPPKS
ncbi:DUF4136 domain-containing protein [Cellulophaga baltica]|uniref:DUF4136 domain-containing protein n=1 Tax=Cellulophaga TaxID=104264 RepID=UPI001C06D2AC|nr:MULTISPECIES: DUF4136 domain-containing protein [Cellulophaga]MBU2997126.1 DUF4136 domain-containing protein [Cellulophaga baltica]MDO6768524.1 DUF4136 domain-containing protein [Cellulophaga sp. 1_MG-2023]